MVQDDHGSVVVFSYPLPGGRAETRLEPLTSAEREVVELLMAAVPVTDIARQRGCTARTVTKHIEAIHKKLGVHSRRELIATLSEAGYGFHAVSPGK